MSARSRAGKLIPIGKLGRPGRRARRYASCDECYHYRKGKSKRPHNCCLWASISAVGTYAEPCPIQVMLTSF
jgi:hypothetical protein